MNRILNWACAAALMFSILPVPTAEARPRRHTHRHRAGYRFHVEVRNIKQTSPDSKSYDATVYDVDDAYLEDDRRDEDTPVRHRTLQCCDGSYSPSCTYNHRGCCSWHGGVCE